MNLKRIAFFTTLLSILCLGASFKSWADDDEIETYGAPESHDFIQHRTYIGVFGTLADINANNDFNGYTVSSYGPVTNTSGGTTVISNLEDDYVPAINQNFGFGGMVGHREGPWAVEASYWYSNHTGSIYPDNYGNAVTFTTTAVYTTLNVDLKRYFLTTIPAQPFIDLGMNFAFLSSQNTSDIWSPNNTVTPVAVGSQTDSGIGLNLGAGLEIYLGDGLSLVGGVIQRFTNWSQISGQEKIPYTPNFSNDSSFTSGSLEGDGLNFYLGTTIGIDE